MPSSDSSGLKRNWAWTVLPVNAGISGFIAWVPLYVLQLGGTVVEVALLTTLYNFILIPSSVFWGRMTDRLGRRRLFFLVSFSGVSVIFLAIYILQNLRALTILYGVLGIVVVANSAALGLLVMETSDRSNWMASFSWLSFLSTVGSVTGTIAGFLWVSFLAKAPV